MDDIAWKPPRRYPFPWPAERIAALQAMVAEGYPRGEIAIELGVTRNAVIGMCWRLGLSVARAPRPKPVRHRIRRDRKPYKPKPKPPKEVAVQMPVEAPPEPAHVSAAGPRPFMALTSRTCRWPLWSDTRWVPFDEQWYCGEPVACDGRPYCGVHTAQAYARGSGAAKWR